MKHARDLPVMNTASQLTDAYAEVRFGPLTHRTEVARRTLHPAWRDATAVFEVTRDEDLLTDPLVVRVLDHDTVGQDVPVGQVVIDLAPLRLPDSPGELAGWFPVYDTLSGARGAVHVHVRLQLFRDAGRSAAAVRFYAATDLPPAHTVTALHGLVEELFVRDDPEFQWIDKIRTPRASNEARQAVFVRLGAELQRKIGLKAHERGANAVLGYRQHFDLEGDAMVARAIGTAASLAPRCVIAVWVAGF